MDNTTSWLNFAQMPVEQGGLGLQPHQAAGLVGNLVNESGTALPAWGPSGDNGTAWGTAQWRGDRLAALKAAYPDNYQTPEAQQAFMRSEFLGPENASYKALLAAKSPEEAAGAVNHLYERSADNSGNRERAARQIMAQFGGAGGAGPALSFANTEDDDGEEDAKPALATNNVVGQGALTPQRIMNAEGSDNKLNAVAQGMTGIGAALAGISSPQQGYVLNAQLAQMKKDNESKYKVLVDKSGRILRYDQDGNVDMIGGGATPNGAPQMLGDSTKQGDEYFKTLDPVTQQLISSWHDGTGIAPSGYQLKNPQVQAQIAAAQRAFPDMDFQRIPERHVFVSDMSKTSPTSVGGQIASSNASLKHMNNLADAYLGLHNGSGAGWTQAAHVQNALKDQTGGVDRSAQVQALETHGGLASGEITKFITGGPGGVHERAERANKLANSHYSPEEAAGVLDAQRQDLKEKHDILVDKARRTMGDAWLARHPEIETNYENADQTLRDKIAQLRSANNTASNASSSLPKGVKSIQVIQP